MKQLQTLKWQIGLSIVVLLVALIVDLSLFYSVSTGLIVSLVNTGLDRFFIALQYQSSASAGSSLLMLILSVMARLSIVIGGLYVAFSLMTPAGVIVGFVVGHIGYMIDKLYQVK